VFNALSEKQNKKYELNSEKMNSLKKPKKGDKMFEEDFFEAEELQYKTEKNIGNSDELTFDVDRYIRALK